MNKVAIRNIATLALCAAMLFVVQVAAAGLPNIELVSLLIIIYTLAFGYRVLYIIYTFVMLEGFLYGFGIWWISYLYVWTILAGITWIFRSKKSPLGWAILSGTFGLLFGALCTIPYLITGGPAMALAYWVSGIPFDLIHCAGNFVLCLLLWKPLNKLFAEKLRLST